MIRFLKFLFHLNFKTLYFNFTYLPFHQAKKLPFLVSRKVYLSQTKGVVSIEGPITTGMIRIGYGDVGIFDKKRSRSIWQVSGKVIFKGTAHLGHGSKISVGKQGVLELGPNFALTAESAIVSHKQIVFGKNCLVSWECLIMDTDFHKIYDAEGQWVNPPKEIIIGDKVWLGARNTLLKGTKIASHSIIGANSQVSKDISDQSGLFAGNPIKHLKDGIHWEV